MIYFVFAGYFNDYATERPSIPYGFLLYKAQPESIFLPLGMGYGKFLHQIKDFSYVQWEGIAYIGLTGAVGFAIILAGLFVRIIKRDWQNLLKVTDNTVLNVLFWSSVILLLYSFGIPFIFNLEFLVELYWPFKTVESIGKIFLVVFLCCQYLRDISVVAMAKVRCMEDKYDLACSHPVIYRCLLFFQRQTGLNEQSFPCLDRQK